MCIIVLAGTSEGLAGPRDFVHIKCLDAKIVTDFHILPVGGCQIILRVDWLQILDELTLNFKNQSLRLSKGGGT